MLRSPQTRKSVREDHNQQELSHHAEPPEEHHPQKQVQEGPPHGEDACTVLIVSVLDAWWPGRTLYTVKWTISTKCRSENVGVYWNARFCPPPPLSLSGCPEAGQCHPEESEACGGEEEALQSHQECINMCTHPTNASLIKEFWSNIPPWLLFL